MNEMLKLFADFDYPDKVLDPTDYLTSNDLLLRLWRKAFNHPPIGRLAIKELVIEAAEADSEFVGSHSNWVKTFLDSPRKKSLKVLAKYIKRYHG